MKHLFIFITVLILSIPSFAQIMVYDTDNNIDATTVKISENYAYCKFKNALVPTYYKKKLEKSILVLQFFSYEAIRKGEYDKVNADEVPAKNFVAITEKEYNDLINDKEVLIEYNKRSPLFVSNQYITRNPQMDDEIVIKADFCIRTKDCFTGDKKYFFTVSDAKDESLIGKKVMAKVIFSRKSNIGGAEGNLILRPMYIEVDKDTFIPLEPADIYARGKNRTNAKFWCTFFGLWPAIFVPGSGAKILEGSVHDAYIRTSVVK